MGDIQVKGAQAPQQIDRQFKEAGKQAVSNVKTIRNAAAGVAVAGAAAMGAEAMGLVTIPAMIPTGLVTLGAGAVAGVFGIIGAIGDSVDKLVESADKKHNEQLKGQ